MVHVELIKINTDSDDIKTSMKHIESVISSYCTSTLYMYVFVCLFSLG